MRQAPAVYRNVDADEAARLLARDAVRVLDVRTPDEYDAAGHIPGANLLPVDLIAAAPATLPRDGKPLLVYCQHGIRSVTASRFLAAAGFSDVMNLVGGLSCWRGPREHGPASADRMAGPSAWLVQNADLLPRRGRALDVASGSGRHALLLSAAGLSVRGVDRDAEALAELKASARRLGLRVETEVKDLETGAADLGEEAYEIVLVVNYLHRPLFPAITRTLRKGGWLIYETYTTAQAERGKPTDPQFLLEPGELPRLVAPLEVVRQREGEFEGRMVSSVAARKPAK
ncbi:MAG TPA: rhodanese-like domain-containing protein [Vicinamibacteria bacterium]|nr:rhodanese-like domain-containing protein [Vicinamibacteria bacterium]